MTLITLAGHGRRSTVVTGRRLAVVEWRRAVPWLLAAAMSIGIFTRSRMIWAPEGDSALHLRLIQDIARTHRLPTVLPHYPARIGETGVIEAMFPYSYTPLFHLTGAVAYACAGTMGVSMMNSLAAGVISLFIYRFTARQVPWYVALGAGVVAFLPPTTMAVFTHVYMEPLMLAFIFGSAWFFYLALTMRRSRYGVLAGMCMGLAIGTRQAALIYLPAAALTASMYLSERRCWQWRRLRRELRWIVPSVSAMAVVALPFLLYLAYVNGSIGYADYVLPGTHARLAVDPVANGYIASITKPAVGTLGWINAYGRTLMYSQRWLPEWFATVPLLLFVPGIAYLSNRGGSGRFFARLAISQVLAELALFIITHGNDRYVVASRMFVYALLPVGAYGTTHFLARTARRWSGSRRLIPFATAVAVLGVVVFSLVSTGYGRFVTQNQDLMSFRSRAYAQMGDWVNQNTAPDAVILTPRVYSAELTFERDATWVTFYGNAWVIDAITTPDPHAARDILARHGVDYVLIPDPPGTYVDRMPPDGMRSYLQFARDDSPYFTLVYATSDDRALVRNNDTAINGLRLYKVERTPA